jgi:putative polyketide hydroxylase
MLQNDYPVLICGGGLAGLTAALMLAWRGVRPLLVEQHTAPSRNPRARGVNIRSMELLRVAGLEPDLLAAGGDGARDFSIVIAESVTGRVLQTLLSPGTFDTTALSPARMSTAGQDRIEPILRAHAEALGAEIRYGTQLESFAQGKEGVTAVIRDLASGAGHTVRARYLVAADGNRSPVRQQLGIGVHGHGALAENLAIVFEANLKPVLGERGVALYYLQNPQLKGAFINTDVPNRALVSVEYDPATQDPAAFDTPRCIQLVRAALGVPGLEVNILEAAPWTLSSWVAERFTAGRVFLAGDAAHTMPPTGGLGGQTAMQDGYDLAWKLAMVLHGHAGPELLSTYEAERKPVAAVTVELQTANYVERVRPDRQSLRGQGTRHDYMEVAAGYRCRSSAIQEEEAGDQTEVENPLQPSGKPGGRAPHVPFEHRGTRLSSLDLIGQDFVLLAGPGGAAWARAGTALRYDAGLPLSVYRMGADLLDVEKAWESRFGVTPAGAVLLRPDGFIAWRAQGLPPSPGAELAGALACALCRPPESFARASQAA